MKLAGDEGKVDNIGDCGIVQPVPKAAYRISHRDNHNRVRVGEIRTWVLSHRRRKR